MKVLFIGTLPEPMSGQALACQVFLSELRQHHAVEVVDLNKSDYRQGITSFARIRKVLGIAYRVWRLHGSADVVYHTPAQSFAGSMRDLLIYTVCYSRLSRFVIHLHGGAGMREIMLKPHALRRLNKFFLRRIGGAIVLGERLVDIYANVLPRAKIHSVANFAEDDLYTNQASIDLKFSNPAPLRVLFLSNLIPGKGHLELTDAFLALDATKKASIILDFAGGFESVDQETAFRRKIAGEANIRYHGAVRGTRRKELYHQAHVFCLPTYYAYEGQPLSILEAYASGCAVITTDHSGIFDTFTPGINGIQVAKQSVADLTLALTRVIASVQQLRTMASANLEQAEREYRPVKFNARLMAIISSVATTTPSSL